MRNKSIYVIAAAVVLLALVAGLWSAQPTLVNAAPAAVVTPISYTSSGGDGTVTLVDWMSARRLTADTTVCKDLRQYKAADIQWVIDQGTLNTTTIKLRDTIVGGTANLVDEVTLVSANTADVVGMNEYLLHAVDTCVFVDVANTNPITITVVGKAMK